MGVGDFFKGLVGVGAGSAVDGAKSIGEKVFGGPKLSEDEKRRQQLLQEAAGKAGGFADFGEGGFRNLAGDADTARANLLRQANGELSYSKEALRQGLLQNQASQRSMAQAASPANMGMASRTAMMNSARMGSGLAGQQALAGIQEQQGAAKLYADATLAQRQQELQAALQSRQNQMTGLGANNPFVPTPSMFDRMLQQGAQIGAAAAKGGK